MWWPERIYLKMWSKSEEVALGLGTCPVSRITTSPLEGGAGATRPSPRGSSGTLCPLPRPLYPGQLGLAVLGVGSAFGLRPPPDGSVALASSRLWAFVSSTAKGNNNTTTYIIGSFYVCGASNSESRHLARTSQGPGQLAESFHVSFPSEAPPRGTPSLPWGSFWGVRVKMQDLSLLSPPGGLPFPPGVPLLSRGSLSPLGVPCVP